MRINQGLIQKAVSLMKKGDDTVLASILKDLTVSDVINIKRLADTTKTSEKGTDEDKFTQSVLLGSVSEEYAQNKSKVTGDHGVKSDISNVYEDQIYSKELTNYSPILRTFRRGASLNSTDLVSLIPKEYRRDIGIKEIIKGRYSGQLTPTGDYFMCFDDFNSAKSYISLINKYDRRLNGIFVSFQFVPDLSKYIHHMFSPVLPDMRYFPEFLSLAFKQAGFNKGRETVEDKNKAVSDLHDFLVKSRLNNVCSSSNLTASIIQSLNESLLLEKVANNKIKLGSKRSDKSIDRCNCVVFRNVPPKMDSKVIRNFMWDLKWYEVEELCIRKSTNANMHGLDTYVLVFETRKDALRCVNKCNNQHLLYNEKLPIIEAELLDDRP